MLKRFIVLIFTVCSCIAVVAENIKVTVKGTTDKASKEVLVFVNGDNRKMSKVNVTNGTFTYNADVERCSYLFFVDRFTKKQSIAVADDTGIGIDMDKEVSSGTPLNDRLWSIEAVLEKYQAEEQGYRKQAEKEEDGQKAVALRAKARQQKKAYVDALKKAIDENKDNCLPVLLIQSNMLALEFQQLRDYAFSGAEYAMHPLFANVLYYIQSEGAKQSFVGKKFTDFSIGDVNGKRHDLSEYIGKGHYVLVDFWASWCGPCMREMPALKTAKSKYGKNGFEIVGISLDNNAMSWQSAIKEGALNWVHLSDLKGWESNGVRIYNVRSIPSNFLCNGDGIIVAVDLRGERLLEKLEEVYETM